MKKTIRHPVTVLLRSILLYGLAACDSEELTAPAQTPDLPSASGILLSVADSATSISKDRAESVAAQFASTQFHGSRSIEREIGNVYTVEDSIGAPLLYIVNFSNEQGFVIVSAEKGYYPVLAHSNKGHFNIPEEDSPAHLWLDIQGKYITHREGLPEEIKSEIALLWDEYNPKNPISLGSRSGYPPIPQVYYDSLRVWSTSREYSHVYTYNDFKNTEEYNRLSPEERQQLDNSMHMYGNGNYGPVEDVTLVLIQNFSKNGDYPETLLKTQWGQGFPYNSLVPYKSSVTLEKYPLGCTTIAAGQIMRYHEWPSYYNWVNMPYGNYNATETTQKFLYDLALSIGVSFGEDATSGTTDKVRSALEKNNYSVTTQYHNTSTILSEIKYNKPVYMQGIDPKYGGHAWVCDGVKYSIYYHKIRLMTLDYRPTPTIVPTKMVEAMNITTFSGNSGPYFHMNWGENGLNNGFFSDNNIKVTVDTTQYNYNQERIELLVRPNK